MSGIYGAISKNNPTSLTPLAAKMAKVMIHRDWYVNESWEDPQLGIALGRLGIGIFNTNPQPVWNSNQSVCVFMAGEFYQLPSDLTRQSSVESIALGYYEKYGDDFARHLNGAFAITIFDRRNRKIILTNDRYGLYTIYYAQWNGRFLFAPEIKGILCAEKFPRNLDMVALAQYMRFQHLLGSRTFFEDIALLPNASVLIYDLEHESYAVHPYWSFEDFPERPKTTFDEAVEETGALLRNCIQRLSGDKYRPGVFLSGGLDSRTILGLVERRPVVSLNFGQKNCMDEIIAGQIARAVGSRHYWFDLADARWVTDNVDLHLALTEGFHSWIHSHGISILSEARRLIDVNLTGWDGGTVMGHGECIMPLQFNSVDDTALTTYLFGIYNQNYTWPSITEAEENCLYTPAVFKQIQGLAFESFSSELAKFFHLRKDIRAELFYLVNHCGRMTHHMVTTARSHIEVRCPFFDYDLLDFLYSIPAQVRGHRKLYRAVIQRETPKLALIPYDHDGLLPSTNPMIREPHAFAVKAGRRLRKLMKIGQVQTTLYADYENYLRHDLFNWGESILFNQSIEQHGLFNPSFIKSIWARHQSEMEEWTIGKIAPIMTYEMMLRRFDE